MSDTPSPTSSAPARACSRSRPTWRMGRSFPPGARTAAAGSGSPRSSVALRPGRVRRRSAWPAARPSSGSGTASACRADLSPSRARGLRFRGHVHAGPAPARDLRAGQPDAGRVDLGALEDVSAAVESGAGLPEVVRAAGRALDASLLLVRPVGRGARGGGALARGRASLSAAAPGSRCSSCASPTSSSASCGCARARGAPSPVVLRSCARSSPPRSERVRAPERASEEAASAFLHDLLGRQADRDELVAPRRRARPRARGRRQPWSSPAPTPLAPTEEDWRAARARRRRARRARRRARARWPRWPTARDARRRRGRRARARRRRGAAAPRVGRGRAARAARPACPASPSPSVAAASPPDPATCTAPATRRCWPRTSPSATTRTRRVLAFEETGAYRLLLSAMSEDPAELQRFYAETVEPLVAYDEQYETDLVQHARDVPRLRRQRRRDRAAALHPPPHDPLPARARARAVRARRRLHRRAREAVARAEGDARPRHRGAARPGPERAPGAAACRGNPTLTRWARDLRYGATCRRRSSPARRTRRSRCAPRSRSPSTRRARPRSSPCSASRAACCATGRGGRRRSSAASARTTRPTSTRPGTTTRRSAGSRRRRSTSCRSTGSTPRAWCSTSPAKEDGDRSAAEAARPSSPGSATTCSRATSCWCAPAATSSTASPTTSPAAPA